MSVSAYVLIQTEVGKAASVAAEIATLAGVTTAEDVTGPYDVIARVEARNVDELGKLADTAPGADVLVRLSTSGEGSDWPLSGKFGCSVDAAYELLVHAGTLGLRAAGIAFHVGSQQREPKRWHRPIAEAARIFERLRLHHVRPWLLDIGGGLPADHLGGHPELAAYVDTIQTAISRHFGDRAPRLVVEPGRGIAGDAGTLVSSVLGVTWRGGRRWVYLDAGVYTGLVETLGESIRYRLETDHRHLRAVDRGGSCVVEAEVYPHGSTQMAACRSATCSIALRARLGTRRTAHRFRRSLRQSRVF